LAEYADSVVDAIGDRSDLILVAQSLAGFTAPIVCERMPVDLLVMLNAMTPSPGESPGDWWANTGQAQARREQAEREGRSVDDDVDPLVDFFHDVPKEVTEEGMKGGRIQSGKPFEKPWPLESWPEVRTRFLIGREDRFFPAPFQRRVVKERLGFVPDEMPGGHLVALSHPEELARRLEAYRSEG
jgi:pimeloyl-ACP methyl ester carboxylesterase